MLQQRGFRPLVGTQCTYAHESNGMLIVAHVDDFLVLGTHGQLVSLVSDLKSGGYECSGQILGDGEEEVREIKFLGRTISLEDGGITWKGDGRHVTSFISQLLKDFSATSSELSSEGGMKGIKTPGVKRGEDDTVVQVPLSKALAKSYRGLAALANFMSQDRPDLSYAAKEISKTMSSPSESNIPAVKRFGRYIAMFPSCALFYAYHLPLDLSYSIYLYIHNFRFFS